MADLNEKRTNRLKLIHRLYDLCEGTRSKAVSMWGIGEEFGWPRSETQSIVEYLEGEGLLEYSDLGGNISLTHRGIVEVEKSLSKPDEATTYFPPAVNIIHIGHMEKSQIQQGTVDSRQELVVPAGLEELAGFLNEVQEFLKIPAIRDDEKSEIECEIDTIEAQGRSPKPKANIVRSSLAAIKQVLEGIAVDGAADLAAKAGEFIIKLFGS
ncbi:MAG: hypothetical protein KJ970_21210 [Candidatus Eisenbacteria bacterium]|uniref:Uncharacterized protein n=1 Tax=Eiseniibacteriota bacterium TaxID=2212470 RepID=A0A948W8K9_UNCEI|nr:hypothetical protein [Candidatus Eisenbacteria bacterium]MBU2693445.1 hypothetical protein [Candidatus Eisenbacteria bacterium]